MGNTGLKDFRAARKSGGLPVSGSGSIHPMNKVRLRALLKLLLFGGLLVGSLTNVASAQSITGTTGDGIVYSASAGAVSVVGYSGTGGGLVIPSSVTISGSDLPVTTIAGHAFMDVTSLTAVSIPSGVTTIGDGAFELCSGLIDVTIPPTVTSLGDYAFENCFSLTSITIPGSVTSIGNSEFSNCWNLASITISNGVTNIGTYAFFQCSSLTNVLLPPASPPSGPMPSILAASLPASPFPPP